jgi:predicted AlkP superfamily phosphohydrolase/phosphomutase
MTGKTVFIGLDGASFTVLDPLLSRGVMPFLRNFLAQGVRAPLRSVVPPLTPPAWTSLMTGKRPGEHGVFDFFQKESVDSRYFRLSGSQDIGSETIWSLAGARGLHSTALNFPQMFPPPTLNTRVLPGGWMPWKQLRLGCHPPDLFDRLKALPSFNAKELAMDMALEEKALEGCAADEYADWVGLHARRERRWCDILLYLMREEPSELTAILFDGVDKLQHLCWRFLDPACKSANPSSWERAMTEACEGYFRKLDGLIAEIADCAGPDANLVFASDHGFAPSSDIFYVNSWLAQEGFLKWSDAAAKDETCNVGIGHLARHTFELDWEHTLAYAATPSSQGIHIARRPAEGGLGVPPESYDRVKRDIVNGLRGLRNPSTGKPVVAELWTRDDAFAGPFEEMGPDITFLLDDTGVASILRSDQIVKRRSEPVGTHHPVGVFFAGGPAIISGASLPEISILDVAPLLLYLLDVPIPDDLSGRLPTEVIDPLALDQRPASATTQVCHDPIFAAVSASFPAGLAYDADEEATVLKRLKALGYVD